MLNAAAPYIAAVIYDHVSAHNAKRCHMRTLQWLVLLLCLLWVMWNPQPIPMAESVPADALQKICLVVVSTDKRPKMVYDTIRSFEKHNTYPLYQRVLVSDSYHNVTYLHKLRKDPRWTIVLSRIVDGGRHVRTHAKIDHVYHHVLKPQCEWVFFMEDDWKWHRRDFIQHALPIVQAHHHVNMSVLHFHKIHRCGWGLGKHITQGVKWGWQLYYGSWGGFSFYPHLMHLNTRTFHPKDLSRGLSKRKDITRHVHLISMKHTQADATAYGN